MNRVTFQVVMGQLWNEVKILEAKRLFEEASEICKEEGLNPNSRKDFLTAVKKAVDRRNELYSKVSAYLTNNG